MSIPTLTIQVSILFTYVPAAPFVPAVPAEPVEQAVPDVGTAATASHHGEDHMYPLCARDCVGINEMAKFFRSIQNLFTRAQVHTLIRSILILMAMIRHAAAFL